MCAPRVLLLPLLLLWHLSQMRGIAFMWTLTNSLIDAMEGLERAVAAAHGIAMPPPTPATVQQAPPAGHQQQNPAGEGGAVAVAVAAAPAAGGGSGGQAVAEGVEGGDEEAPKPAAAAAAAPSTPPGPPPPGLPPPPTWFQHNFGWAVQLTLVRAGGRTAGAGMWECVQGVPTPRALLITRTYLLRPHTCLFLPQVALGLPLVTSLVHTLGAELSALRRGAGWKVGWVVEQLWRRGSLVGNGLGVLWRGLACWHSAIRDTATQGQQSSRHCRSCNIATLLCRDCCCRHCCGAACSRCVRV